MTLSITDLQSLPANKYLEMLGDQFVRLTFSQLGEDVIVWHLLAHYFPLTTLGFYVDVGAFHPRRYSNTRFLKLKGWRGINIDANSESISMFNAERPDDINVCTGIGIDDRQLTYYKFGNGWNAANTISKEFASTIEAASGEHVASEEKINVRTLNSVLEEYLPKNSSIDFMDIDVEGMDRVVSESLNLSEFRPKILSVELHDSNIYDLKNDKTIMHFVENNYKLVSINLQSFIFIDTSFLNKSL